MSRIISISLTDKQYIQMTDLSLSPTAVFRKAIDEVFNERYGAQATRKELEANILKINVRFNNLLEYIKNKGLDVDEFIKHI